MNYVDMILIETVISCGMKNVFCDPKMFGFQTMVERARELMFFCGPSVFVF